MSAEEQPEDQRERARRRIKRFYSISAEREWERLTRPFDGRLEFAINKAWIGRFLPPAGSRVLDIGGGPGRYSIWLAEEGYRVTLADLSPDLLEIARGKAKEAGADLEALVEANACDLTEFPEASFDVALCLGPLYHIMFEDERQAAARELFRVLKPGAVVFTAFLNRLQVLRVAIDQDIPLFTPYTFDIVKRWHYDGVLDFAIPGTFNLAYLFRPQDVPPFMEAAGFKTIDLISSQSIAGDRQKDLAGFAENQPDLYEWVMSELIKMANEPSIIGSGFHLLHIGRKPGE